MKRYRLKKDLPTFQAGDEFELNDNGDLYMIELPMISRICAYTKDTLKKFPNILKDWFEDISDRPETVWDLEEGDYYCYLDSFGYIDGATWAGNEINERRRSMGSVFLTRTEAEKELARRKAKVILERDTKGFKPKKNSEYFYNVYWDVKREMLMVEEWNSAIAYARQFTKLNFSNKGDAEASIKDHKKEWKIYLGVEDGD